MSPRPRAATLLLAGLALTLPASPYRDMADPPEPPANSDCALAAAGRGRVERDAMAVRLQVAQQTAIVAGSLPPPVYLPIRGGAPAPSIPHINYIDDEIFGAMNGAGITPAPLASDAEFLRRVTLDLTGRIPDAATVSAFLADTSANKRDKLIETLLASDTFVDRWTLFFDDLYRVTFNPDFGKLGVGGRNALHAYFQDALRSRKRYDQVASELIAAVGDSYASGPPNFEVRNLQPNGPPQDTYDNLASSTGSVFLGTSILCLSCHNGAGHTDQINLWMSKKTRQDFWGMAAFFSRTRAMRIPTGMSSDYKYDVTEAATGEYLLNTTTGNKTPRAPAPGQPNFAAPKFILTGESPKTGEGYRTALVRMLVAHPQFARATVNYLWRELYVLGIVEPADGFDVARQDPDNPPPAPWTIQPTHPRLLDRLGQDFAASGFDLRSIVRTMVRSSAYQLSTFYPGEWKDSYTPYFARHYARRLRAEEIFDGITQATGVPASLPVLGYPTPVAWAEQLPDPLEPTGSARGTRIFLDTFGRGDRDSEPRDSSGSIAEALAMMNNTIVTDRVRSTTAGSTVKKLIDAGKSPEEIVSTLYLTTLSRPPSTSELARALSLFSNMKPGETRASVAEDLQFALLNKLDFLFND